MRRVLLLILPLVLALVSLRASANTAQYLSSSNGGATSDAQITTAAAALPSGNGTLIANYSSNQSWAACPTWGLGNITLILYAVTYAIAANCTIPANVTLQFMSGALLSPASSITVTVNGPVLAGDRQQIIDPTNGTVAIAHMPYVSVDWWGAKGDGGNDDTLPIQAAINAECSLGSSTAKPQIMTVSGDRYRLQPNGVAGGYPTHLWCSNVIFGSLNGQTSASMFPASQGPLFVVTATPANGYCPITPCTTIAAPLVTGITTSGGNSYFMSNISGPRNSYWFNCTLDSSHCNLNGLTAFTAEGYIKPVDLSGGPNYLLGSAGQREQGTLSQAFGIGTNGTTLFCNLKTSGSGTVSIGGGSLSVGTVYHVAMSWDGSNLRCFLNGTQVSLAVAATGTLVQAAWEQVTLGVQIQSFPESTTLSSGFFGTVDSPKLSKTARYTANFTAPTAKLTSDGNTLWLMNFDNCQDVFCNFANMDNNTTAGFSFLAEDNLSGATGVGFVELRNLNLQGGNTTLRVSYAQDCIWDNLNLGASSSQVGMYFDFNNFRERISNSSASSYTLVGIMSSTAFDALMDYTKVVGGIFGYALAGGSIQGNFMQATPDGNSVISLYLNGAGSDAAEDIQNFQCDAEVAGVQACILASQVFHLTLDTSSITQASGATAPIWIDGGRQIIIMNSLIAGPGANQVHIVNPPTFPVRVISSNDATGGTYTPWCDVTDSCYVEQVGFKTVAFSATPVFDCAAANQWKETLTANVTSSTLINCAKGPALTFVVCQDGTGGRTFSWPGNVVGGGSCSTASQCGVQQFIYDGTNARAVAGMNCN